MQISLLCVLAIEMTSPIEQVGKMIRLSLIHRGTATCSRATFRFSTNSATAEDGYRTDNSSDRRSRRRRVQIFTYIFSLY